MRAAVYTKYGPPDVVHIENVPKPVPDHNEVLIRVRAATVCAADWRLRKADPFITRFFNGLWRPAKTNILGMELAGTIESVGKSVTRFRVGDEIFGLSSKLGAHAEFVCMPEDGVLAIKPKNMSLEESAAVLFGGLTALTFLRKAKIHPGQKVLIYGASGSVGVFAVQLAKSFGASVTGVCGTANVGLVKSLGADEVIDYTVEDFSKQGCVYDLVFDTVGKGGISRTLRSLKPGGVYVREDPAWLMISMFVGMWASITARVKVVGGIVKGATGDQAFLKERIEAGKLRTVIDKRYSLDQIAEAHRHAESGHKKGHVLVMLEQARR